MESLGTFSDKYLKYQYSQEEQDKQYHLQILSIAKNIYEIEINSRVFEIDHNFDLDYNEFILFIQNDYNYQYFENIELLEPMKLICKDFQSSISLPDNCTEIISSFIKKNIPYYVINDIINIWYESFKRKIKQIIDDNKFDRNWYVYGTDDYNWACDTIKNCQEALYEVQERLTNPGKYYKDKYKDG